MARIYRSLLLTCLALLLCSGPALAATLFVDINNSSGIEAGSAAHPFRSIQSAIDNAAAADTVIVKPGIYTESVRITKALTLLSEFDKAAVVKSAIQEPYPASIRISASNVTVSGFRLEQGSIGGNYGIIASGQNCLIKNNESVGNAAAGIFVTASNNTVEDNIIRNCNNGLVVQGGSSLITRNEISGCQIGVRFGGWWEYIPGKDNTFAENNVVSCITPIYTNAASSANWVYHNNFINNTNPALIVSPPELLVKNFTDGGNYWSDWTAPDLNDDGIIDQPRGFDLYPVTEPYGWENLRLQYSVFNRDTGKGYYTINAAIQDASAGETIEVSAGNAAGSGIYYESTVIDRPLTLVSGPGQARIKNGSDWSAYPTSVRISASNVTVSGFRLEQGPIANNYGIIISGQNCLIEDNEFVGNGTGVFINASNNMIENNIISNCKNGLVVQGDSSLITGNEISGCQIGVRFGGWWEYIPGKDNTFAENNVVSCITPIYTNAASSANWVYHNNFINNTNPALIVSPPELLVKNFTDGGNYWSDWTAPDLNDDGIIDQPRGFDLYPVTEPYGWENLRLEYSVFNRDTGKGYYTINAAIQDAFEGETIEVSAGNATSSGIYYESTVIDRPLTLVSGPGQARIKNGSDWSAYPTSVRISASNVTVSGFRLEQGPIANNYGIIISGQNCLIKDNESVGNGTGIFINASNNTIENNVISNCKHGLVAQGYRSLITGNEISGCMNGVRFGGWWEYIPGTENTFVDNDVVNCVNLMYATSTSRNNLVYHNNFIDNQNQAQFTMAGGILIIKDYPEGGNFWSHWTTPDEYSGPGQDVYAVNGDGIVDKPISFDRYPFIEANGWMPKNTPPKAFAGPDLSVYVGEAVVFDASLSSDADGPIVAYAWTFGDGDGYSETATDAADGAFDGKTNHTFADSGVFTLALAVTDTDGATGVDDAQVTVLTLADGLDNLIDIIIEFGLPKGAENALLAKIRTAQELLALGDIYGARSSFEDLMAQISAPGFTKNKLPEGFADTVVPEIERLIALLN